MKLLVVESPAKAKTINKYLGSDYEVIASFGHIRDLPAKDGSVDPENDFAMKWEIEGRGAKQVAEIARALKGAEKLILATDPDREGEAISWHVLEALNQKKVLKGIPVERVTFNAVTKDAVQKALANPRAIDQALVDAYLARRALDYLVGFTLSPVLWRKLPGARSAGRVQSVALRLVCDREREIEAFRAREYWSLVATLATTERRRPSTPASSAPTARRSPGSTSATARKPKAFKAALETALFTVSEVEAKPVKRHPQPPFQTSTLQQEASRKLGWPRPGRCSWRSVSMRASISAARPSASSPICVPTASTWTARRSRRRAASSARNSATKYVPGAPRKYTVKAKNAQEAHEAIRPTDLGGCRPWSRAISSRSRPSSMS